MIFFLYYFFQSQCMGMATNNEVGVCANISGILSCFDLNGGEEIKQIQNTSVIYFNLDFSYLILFSNS